MPDFTEGLRDAYLPSIVDAERAFLNPESNGNAGIAIPESAFLKNGASEVGDPALAFQECGKAQEKVPTQARTLQEGNLPSEGKNETWNLQRWLEEWSVPEGRLIHGGDVKKRIDDLCNEHLPEWVDHLYDRDPSFHVMADRQATKLQDARGGGRLGDADATYQQCTKNLSGLANEHLAEDAIKPNSRRIETQRFESVGSSYTKTDIVFYKMKRPMALHGQYVPENGSLAIEVKTGKPSYLESQKEHMKTQVQGHRSADASLVFTSKDLHDLPPRQEHSLRQELKDQGSNIAKYLPPKADMDSAVCKLVNRLAS